MLVGRAVCYVDDSGDQALYGLQFVEYRRQIGRTTRRNMFVHHATGEPSGCEAHNDGE